MTNVRKQLPKDVSVCALLAALIASAFVVVIPSLHAMQAMPQSYMDLLPVFSHVGDQDMDGILDSMDATPYGNRNLHAAAEEGE